MDTSAIKIEHETLGFLNKTSRKMLEHLLDRGGALDFADTKNLSQKRWRVERQQKPTNLLQQSGEGNEKSPSE